MSLRIFGRTTRSFIQRGSVETITRGHVLYEQSAWSQTTCIRAVLSFFLSQQEPREINKKQKRALAPICLIPFHSVRCNHFVRHRSPWTRSVAHSPHSRRHDSSRVYFSHHEPASQQHINLSKWSLIGYNVLFIKPF